MFNLSNQVSLKEFKGELLPPFAGGECAELHIFLFFYAWILRGYMQQHIQQV